MSKEYNLSNKVKAEAQRRAKDFSPGQRKDVHHIVPKSIAKKYRLPKEVITSIENAIAIEQDTFHAWIHGKKLCREDEICDWTGFSEEDFIFLAISLLGIDPKYFNR